MLSTPVEGGGTFRDHARQLERTGFRVEELHFDPPPMEAVHVLHYWYDMSAMRGSSGFGPSPLTPSLIIGWQELRQINLMPVEIDMLMAIEQKYMVMVAKRLSTK